LKGFSHGRPHIAGYLRPGDILQAFCACILLLGIDIVITLIYRASVEAQGGAYATGVLVLMLSAAVAVTIAT
jgi:hypothetical protein